MRTIFEFLAKLFGDKRGTNSAPLSSADEGQFMGREQGAGGSASAHHLESATRRDEALVGENVEPSNPASAVPQRCREETLAAITQVEWIPANRSTIEDLRQLIARSGVSLEEIVVSISRDPFLSLSVLREANALGASSRSAIHDIATAVQMLGVLRLGRVTEAHMEFHKGSDSPMDLDHRRLWIHSLAVGRISEKLSEWLNVSHPRRLYFGGLWHDAGKRVLSHIFPDTYREVVALASNEGVCLETLERQFFGMTHLEAGAIYADQCGVGPLVLQAVAYHASPEDAQLERGGTAVVSIANHLANLGGMGASARSGHGADDKESSLIALSAWTVLTAETGRKPDVRNLYRSLQPFLESLASDLESLHKSL